MKPELMSRTRAPFPGQTGQDYFDVERFAGGGVEPVVVVGVGSAAVAVVGGAATELLSGSLAEGDMPVVLSQVDFHTHPATAPDTDRTLVSSVVGATQISVEHARALLPSGAAPGNSRDLWRVAANAPTKGVLRATVARSGEAWSVVGFYGPDSKPRWRTTFRVADGPATVAAIGLSPDGNTVVVAVASAQPGEIAGRLIGYRVEDGRELWRHDLDFRPWGWRGSDSAGALAVASDGKTFALVTEENSARCKGCQQAEIRRLDSGERLRAIPLTVAGDARLDYGRNTHFGFDGSVVWFYRYTRPTQYHTSIRPETCGYEVYDALRSRDKPLRTLADATGEWAEASRDCGVRALLPLGDGSVVAVRYASRTMLELLRFRRAP